MTSVSKEVKKALINIRKLTDKMLGTPVEMETTHKILRTEMRRVSDSLKKAGIDNNVWLDELTKYKNSKLKSLKTKAESPLELAGLNIKSSKNLFKKNSNIKLYLTDLTTNLKVYNTCNKFVCKEVLKNINNSKESIDIAIYGYSRIPEIETALKSAQERGVKIRLVYDSDKNGGNIYPATDVIAKLIQNSKNDRYSLNPEYIMHNKFYIFDNKTVIIGSANLSNTDMSEFNSNAILTINSRDLAKIYTKEFEQLYSGKFHSEKIKIHNSKINIDNTEIEAYFSPQDKITHNVILPMIKHAQNYIYIPTFLITDMKIVKELINAQARGVEVKIIIDALNASGKYSKHKILRNAGILVKTENYAGKMHSKSMIIDDKYTLIGSMNFSNSGENTWATLRFPAPDRARTPAASCGERLRSSRR